MAQTFSARVSEDPNTDNIQVNGVDFERMFGTNLIQLIIL